MHELSVIQALCKEVEAIAEKNNAKEVLRVVLEVSDSSHMISEHLEETFLIFREASQLLRNTRIEFRQSTDPTIEGIVLRDVELEIDDES